MLTHTVKHGMMSLTQKTEHHTTLNKETQPQHSYDNDGNKIMNKLERRKPAVFK